MGSRLGRGRPNRPLVHYQMPSAIAYTQDIADPVGILDVYATNLIKTLSDLVGVLDSQSQQLGSFRSVSDIAGISDTNQLVMAFGFLANDVLGIIDSMFTVNVYAQSLNDLEDISDSSNEQVIVYFQAVNEQIGLLDDATWIVAYDKLLIEDLSSIDILADAVSSLRALSENLNIDDEIDLAQFYNYQIDDNIDIVEFLSLLAVFSKDIQDNIGLADLLGGEFNAVRIVEDIAGFTDLISILLGGKHFEEIFITTRKVRVNTLSLEGIETFNRKVSVDSNLTRGSETNIVNDHDEYTIVVRP